MFKPKYRRSLIRSRRRQLNRKKNKTKASIPLYKKVWIFTNVNKLGNDNEESSTKRKKKSTS